MKVNRKVISFILVLALVLCSYTTAFASFWQNTVNTDGSGSPTSVTDTTSNAQLLNSLGLYNGTSATTFNPDLSGSLNRETGVIMLLRLMGLEDEASNMTDAQADTILSGFSDQSSISSWSRNSLAYAVQQNIVNGMPNGTIGAHNPLNINQFTTIILRSLGYSPNFNTAPQQYAQLGGLTPAEQSTLFGSGGSLNRGQLAGISLNTLTMSPANSSTPIIRSLVNTGVVTQINVDLIPGFNAAPASESSDSGSSHRHLSGNIKTEPSYTVTASSIHAGGDTVTFNFAAAIMTPLPYALYYHGTPAGTKTSINIAHASTVWSNGYKTLTITLDEAMDEAYIPNNQFISAVVTGTALNGLATTTSAICTSDKVSGESVAPQLSSWSLNMHNHFLTLNFNEFVERDSMEVAEITLKATATTTTSTHALATSTVTGAATYGSSLPIELSDADYSALTAASIGTSAGSSFIDLNPGAIRDLVGNNNTSTSSLAITSANYIPDYPELTASSGLLGSSTSFEIATGDAIMLYFTRAVNDVFGGCTVRVEGSRISIISSTSAVLVTMDSQNGQNYCSGGEVVLSSTHTYSPTGDQVAITLTSIISGSGTLLNPLSPDFPTLSLYPAVTDLSGNGWSSSVRSDFLNTY